MLAVLVSIWMPILGHLPKDRAELYFDDGCRSLAWMSSTWLNGRISRFPDNRVYWTYSLLPRLPSYLDVLLTTSGHRYYLSMIINITWYSHVVREPDKSLLISNQGHLGGVYMQCKLMWTFITENTFFKQNWTRVYCIRVLNISLCPHFALINFVMRFDIKIDSCSNRPHILYYRMIEPCFSHSTHNSLLS